MGQIIKMSYDPSTIVTISSKLSIFSSLCWTGDTFFRIISRYGNCLHIFLERLFY
mgnify:CR=1 FL=1